MGASVGMGKSHPRLLCRLLSGILDLKESVVAAWRRGPRVWRLDRPDPRADGDRTATFFSARGPFPAEKEDFNPTTVSSPPAGGTAGKSCGRYAFRAVCVHVRVSVCAHVRPVRARRRAGLCVDGGRTGV